MNKFFNKNLVFLNYILIFFISILVCFYSGYRGVFPIDSFLIFNSGYNVLNDIHPFKDYWAITGPLLDYIQGLLFFIFGLNWYAYVLHAAIINGLLSILCFYLFLHLRIKIVFASIYAVSISLLAYASIGTPFVDHHATIFSAIAITFVAVGLLKNKNIFWYLSGSFFTLAIFSKQIPSLYLLLFVCLIILINFFILNIKNKKNIIFFISGVLTGVILFLLLLISFQVPLKNFIIQYFYYPMSIGEDRIKNLNLDFKNSILQFKFIYFAILPILTIFIYNKKKGKEFKKDLILAFLVIGSIFIFIYSQLLTKNQILIFYLIPWSLDFSHYFINKYYNKSYTNYLLVFLLIITTIKYHLRFTNDKKFMELSHVNFNKSVDAVFLDNKLRGLQWITPKFSENPKYELELLRQTKNVIERDTNNKIIITNYLMLPAITNNKNYAPNKWFDDLSVPKKNNVYFKFYQDFFLESLKKQKIKNIYIIGGKRKTTSLLNTIKNKDCIFTQSINEISKKISIKNCLNEK